MAMTMSTLLVLLSVLTVSHSCGAAAAAALPVPVYDTDGHELSADADYYVLPAPRGGGGGLTLEPINSTLRPCPLFLAPETDPLRKGLPVRFTPLQQQAGGQGGNGNGGEDPRTVRVSSDVGVRFVDLLTTCVQNTEWHVSGDAPPPGHHRLVVTGPVVSSRPSGREKVFRVEKHGPGAGGGYKLVWCGFGAAASTSSCQDLGVVTEVADPRPWLGVTEADRAHAVVFQKAKTV